MDATFRILLAAALAVLAAAPAGAEVYRIKVKFPSPAVPAEHTFLADCPSRPHGHDLAWIYRSCRRPEGVALQYNPEVYTVTLEARGGAQ